MSQILIATNNPGKLIEFKALMHEFDLITPDMIGLQMEIDEHGQTYAENAAFKAQAFARASGLFTIADDSGLEVDALDGAPGIYSARFAPNAGATDADRRAYLLKRLSHHPQPWTARFRCVIAIATPTGDLQYAEGVCDGEIVAQERGSGGFGYDPVFLLPELGLTMAELSLEQKNSLSHRSRAVLAARPILANVL